GSGIDKGEAVVARVEVKKISREWPQNIVAQPKAQDIGVKWHNLIEPRGGQHRMPHAKRSGAEAGNRAPWLERLGGKLRAVGGFEPIANRIAEDDQILNATLLGERA